MELTRIVDKHIQPAAQSLNHLFDHPTILGRCVGIPFDHLYILLRRCLGDSIQVGSFGGVTRGSDDARVGAGRQGFDEAEPDTAVRAGDFWLAGLGLVKAGCKREEEYG